MRKYKGVIQLNFTHTDATNLLHFCISTKSGWTSASFSSSFMQKAGLQATWQWLCPVRSTWTIDEKFQLLFISTARGWPLAHLCKEGSILLTTRLLSLRVGWDCRWGISSKDRQILNRQKMLFPRQNHFQGKVLGEISLSIMSKHNFVKSESYPTFLISGLLEEIQWHTSFLNYPRALTKHQVVSGDNRIAEQENCPRRSLWLQDRLQLSPFSWNWKRQAHLSAQPTC